jgi:hypothetical protein
MVAKLTRLTHNIAIQLYLVVESCTICNSRSRAANFWIHLRAVKSEHILSVYAGNRSNSPASFKMVALIITRDVRLNVSV